MCEDRDPKGYYQKARSGEMRGFTGVDDAYESPLSPEVILNTTEMSVAQNVELLMQEVVNGGFTQHSE